jgi:hypothetical protein
MTPPTTKFIVDCYKVNVNVMVMVMVMIIVYNYIYRQSHTQTISLIPYCNQFLLPSASAGSGRPCPNHLHQLISFLNSISSHLSSSSTHDFFLKFVCLIRGLCAYETPLPLFYVGRYLCRVAGREMNHRHI